MPTWDEWVMWAGTAFGAALVAALVHADREEPLIMRRDNTPNRQAMARAMMHRSLDVSMIINDNGQYAVFATRWDDGHPFAIRLDEGIALSHTASYCTAILADATRKLAERCAKDESTI